MTVYSVSQITRYVRDLLERDPLLSDLWVSGEVSNLSRSAAGHYYFSLRDATSSLRCVMFARRAQLYAQHLDDGAAVVVHGRASVYEARGDLQLIADVVQPEGVGELQLRLEELKARLEGEGLFDKSRKRPLPAFPRRIAVVTSPTGAVWHDIRNVVGRRWPLVELVLVPTPVQGEEAVPGIVEAFQALDGEDLDLVILARGGGSLEDLWAFNEEAVARAVFACPIPVISAVGHETDYTIADLVADVRAPTPSAAAEMAVPDAQEMAGRVASQVATLETALYEAVGRGWQTVAQLRDRLAQAMPDAAALRSRVEGLLRTAARHLTVDLRLRQERAQGLRLRLEALSPEDTLRRGYAIVRGPDGGVVVEARRLAPGDAVAVTVARGAFDATVSAVPASPDGRGAPQTVPEGGRHE